MVRGAGRRAGACEAWGPGAMTASAPSVQPGAARCGTKMAG